MFKVQADRVKNLLAVNYFARVAPEEAERCTEATDDLLRQLQPGFDLITDLTGLEEMDAACAPHLQNAMDHFSEYGVKKVVRVIPDPSKDIGLSIMSLFHYPRDIQIVTCATVDEAMKVLVS